ETILSDNHNIQIRTLEFDDFSLDPEGMLTSSLYMFKETGILEKFKIDHELICAIKNKVKSVLFMFLQPRSHSSLSQLYGAKATMEYHHFNHAVMILNSEGHNIFANLTSEQYTHIMQLLKHAILATDLAQYFKSRGTFFNLVDNGQCNWEIKEHKDVLRGMLMTASDVGAVTKPWDIQKRVVELVTNEFFEQGDKERKELNIEPHVMFDRRRKDELPEMQVGFIDSVCVPLYQALYKIDSNLRPLYDGVKSNRHQWALLVRRRSTGDSSRSSIDTSPFLSKDSAKGKRSRHCSQPPDTRS
ncbi:LOW QUALITY PROTEIN: dual 3',5'-cyclic-AMP and -GMP phosphodiesterase 11A-like, partial [Saccoglossus kowalevskii]